MYLPDLKFMDIEMAGYYTENATDYPENAPAAITGMYRQTGDLVTDRDGNAVRYSVEYRASAYPYIARSRTPAEFLEVINRAEQAVLSNLGHGSLMQREVLRRRDIS